MLRIFRAFAWLRWRVLLNTLERTGARDTLERFALATQQLGPLLALALLVPSGVAVSILGLVAGYGPAGGTWVLPLTAVRFFLLLVMALTLLGPVVLPSQGSGNTVRLLLLPIPRGVLYVAHMMGALMDPWILLMVPLIAMVPVGLLAGGKGVAAALALLAGMALVVFVIGVTTLVSSVIHLLLRNRRRGDLVMLVVVLLIPLFSLLPSIMQAENSANSPPGASTRSRRGRQNAPPWVRHAANTAVRYVPSELYHFTVQTSVTSPAAVTVPLGALFSAALVVQALGFGAFRRMLDMPVSIGARRVGAFGGVWGRTIPGLSPGASAVALTQLRLALRTPRGRSMIAAPLLFFAVFSVMIYRNGRMPFAAFTPYNGLNLAGFGCFFSLMAILPLAMNQFAVDKAGFTRLMLSPLSISELLTGKMVGNGLVSLGPALICLLLSAMLFPGGPPALWGALLLSLFSIFFLISPAAAALSALFPKVVDLNSIGHGSNAHQAAGLLGVLSYIVAAAPCVLLVLLARSLLHRLDLAALFMFVWCGIAFALSRILFIPVRRLVASRCETLAQYY